MMRALFGLAFVAGALTCTGATAAEPLGRLFFTPAQRNALDAGKRVGAPPPRAPEPRGPQEVRLNGIVTRSDGESTIWVNGRPSDLSPLPHVSVSVGTDPTSAQVRAPGVPGGRKISVGQSLDTRSGVVREAYAQGLRTGAAQNEFVETPSLDSTISRQTPTAARTNQDASVSDQAGQR